MEPVARAAEGGHYYTRAGEPAYTVIARNGQPRPTTLADARKLNLVPSVTTILKASAKPGLEVWKQRQVLLSALTCPRLEGETDDDLVRRILLDAAEQAKKAADRGTEIHGAIERLLRHEPVIEYQEHAKAAIEAVANTYGADGWSSERAFCYRGLFGGKVDLHAIADRYPTVIDFKTKDGDPEDARLWPEHFMQLGAYSLGLGIPDARCAVVFVSRDMPKAVLVPAKKSDIERGRRQFLALLAFWQEANDYRLAEEVA